MSVEQRMNIAQIAPEAYRHLLQMEKLIADKLDRKLIHLIKLRASQINGCAYCIVMHTEEALADGEPPHRLTLLDAWQESSLYDDKERAVLRWVDEVTLISQTHASSEAFEALKAHFTTDEIGWLTLAGVLINAWNRIAISSRQEFPVKALAPKAPAAQPVPA
jgi:AhpD family alkylhydroperoxidase